MKAGPCSERECAASERLGIPVVCGRLVTSAEGMSYRARRGLIRGIRVDVDVVRHRLPQLCLDAGEMSEALGRRRPTPCWRIRNSQLQRWRDAGAPEAPL